MIHFVENPRGPAWIWVAGGLAGVTVIALAAYAMRDDTAPVTGGPAPGPGLPPPPGPTPTPSPGPIGPGGISPAPPPQPPSGPTTPAPTESPGGEAPAGTPVTIHPATVSQLNLADYPWEKPYVHLTSPTPAMFYVVKANDNIFDIARVSAAATLAMAGRPELATYFNPNHPEFGSTWVARLRTEMRNAIICSWYHDRLYGQTDPVKAGGQFGMGPMGRGLNFLPRHANQIARAAAGLYGLRTTDIKGDRLHDYPDATNHMTLYIPAPDLNPLRTGAKESLTFQFYSWANGVRHTNPPPVISDGLGADSIPEIPEGGCPGWN